MSRRTNRQEPYLTGSRRQAVSPDASLLTGRPYLHTREPEPMDEDESLQRGAKRAKTRQTQSEDQIVSLTRYDHTWLQPSPRLDNVSHPHNALQDHGSFDLGGDQLPWGDLSMTWDQTHSLGFSQNFPQDNDLDASVFTFPPQGFAYTSPITPWTGTEQQPFGIHSFPSLPNTGLESSPQLNPVGNREVTRWSDRPSFDTANNGSHEDWNSPTPEITPEDYIGDSSHFELTQTIYSPIDSHLTPSPTAYTPYIGSWAAVSPSNSFDGVHQSPIQFEYVHQHGLNTNFLDNFGAIDNRITQPQIPEYAVDLVLSQADSLSGSSVTLDRRSPVLSRPYRKRVPKNQNQETRKGVRKNPLSPEERETVKNRRIDGVCLPCKLQKDQCRMVAGALCCGRCLKREDSPWLLKCINDTPESFHRFFFPDIVTARYRDDQIESVFAKITTSITDNCFTIHLSWGKFYPSLQMRVYEFVPLDSESLVQKYVQSPVAQGLKTFTNTQTPPICLLPDDLSRLKEDILNHVKVVSKRRRDEKEVSRGDTHTIVWRMVEVITDYERAMKAARQKDSLLRDALMLYSMNYMLSRLFMLTKDSAQHTVSSLRSPALPYDSKVFASNLLNLQVKKKINELVSVQLESLLRRFQRILFEARGRAAVWTSSFCAMLILCTCIESVQTATDAFAQARIRERDSIDFTREQYFFLIEDKVYDTCMRAFHKANKSHKLPSQRRFNPIADGLEVNPARGITQQAVDLVRKVRRYISENEAEMKLRAKSHDFDSRPEHVFNDHMVFRVKNSGRLVSKFLLSFIHTE